MPLRLYKFQLNGLKDKISHKAIFLTSLFYFQFDELQFN